MPEITERPARVRKVTVETPGAIKEGDDLNDVLRQIIFDIKTANGWTTAETAKHLGMSQQTLYSFMVSETAKPAADAKPPKSAKGKSKKTKGRGRGMTLYSLSTIIAARGTTPVAFFGSHPLYRSRSPFSIPIDHYAYEGLCALLDPKLAKDLTGLLEVYAAKGKLAEFVDVQREAFGLNKKAARTRKKGGAPDGVVH